jgi:hypothetical protein
LVQEVLDAAFGVVALAYGRASSACREMISLHPVAHMFDCQLLTQADEHATCYILSLSSLDGTHQGKLLFSPSGELFLYLDPLYSILPTSSAITFHMWDHLREVKKVLFNHRV